MNNEEFAKKIFTRLFDAVGRDYSRDATAVPDWFLKCSWTKAKEIAFSNWLERELRNHRRIGKRAARFQAGMFLLYFGWKLELEESRSASARTKKTKARTSNRRKK